MEITISFLNLIIWDLTFLIPVAFGAILITAGIIGIRKFIRWRKAKKATRSEKRKARKERVEEKTKKYNDELTKFSQKLDKENVEGQTIQREAEKLLTPSDYLKELKNNHFHNVTNDKYMYSNLDDYSNKMNMLKKYQKAKVNGHLNLSEEAKEKEALFAEKLEKTYGINPLQQQNYDFVASVEDPVGKKVYDKRNAFSVGNEEIAEEFVKEFNKTYENGYNPMEEPEKPYVGRFDMQGGVSPMIFSTTNEDLAHKAIKLCIKQLVNQGSTDKTIFPVSMTCINDNETREELKWQLASLDEAKEYLAKLTKYEKQNINSALQVPVQ